VSSIVPFGDRALRFDVPSALDRRRLLEALRGIPGILDAVLAETAAAVILAPSASPAAVEASIAKLLASASSSTPASASARAPALHIIHVAYDGPDLASVAIQVDLTTEEVIARHTAPDYEVAMLGFMPGFAYLRGLDPRLAMPRRAEPRPRVPAGAVAIAAQYTGIYPFASPGGWNLLGGALDHRAFDPHGARFALGDRVRFERVARDAQAPVAGSPKRADAIAPRGAHLEVRKAQGLSIVVDAGRTGHMHEGVPHGGALVPTALARANASAGNDDAAAAFEVYGTLEVVARGGPITVGDDVAGPRVLHDGDAVAVSTAGRARARYLAVRGGVDVPVLLGGRGTMLVAALGGYDGRPLKRGDRIALATATAAPRPNAIANANAITDANADASDASADGDIEVLLGPDFDDRVGAAIVGATFTIGAASDRVGTRLEGAPLPPHSMHTARDRASMPMVCGAIEVTPAGLIVLGPDHPTTGGYPVIAVVTTASRARLFAHPIGARVRLIARLPTPT
jgi:KipI family sensor histidine kinase inhibitor